MTPPVRADRSNPSLVALTEPAGGPPAPAAPTAPPTTTGTDPRSTFQPAADPRASLQAAHETFQTLRTLDTATGALTTAQRAREGADQELARRLSRYASGLTPAQQQQYISAYRSEHRTVYEAEQTAATNLAQMVRAQGPELERAAALSPTAAQPVAAALAALASSPEAATAVEFASRIRGGTNAAANANLNAVPNFERDVFERGIPNAAAAIAAANPDDPVAAARDFAKMVAPLGTLGAQGNQVFQQYQRMAAGQHDLAANLAERFRDASPMMRGFAAAGVLTGAINTGVQFHNGNVGAGLEALARTGQSGAELIASAAGALTQGTRFAMVGARAATVAARLAPGLGVLANATSLAVNANNLLQTRNAGYAVAALGDSIALLGSAIGTFPPAAVPGALVAAFGTAVSAGGDFLAGRIADARSREEEVRSLRAAGLPEAVARRFVENPEGIRTLSAQGQSPQAIQDLAAQPNASSFLGREPELQMTSGALGQLGVTAQQYSQFVRHFSGPELTALTMGLTRAGQPIPPAQARAYLEALVRDSGFNDAAKQAIRELLAAHPA